MEDGQDEQMKFQTVGVLTSSNLILIKLRSLGGGGLPFVMLK
jgi:hypothetical protein